MKLCNEVKPLPLGLSLNTVPPRPRPPYVVIPYKKWSVPSVKGASGEEPSSWRPLKLQTGA